MRFFGVFKKITLILKKIAWQIGKAFVLARSSRREAMIPGSSAVEHSTVNRQVAGSNPARGASLSALLKNKGKQTLVCFPFFFFIQ
jgi:hypothetical protein